MADVESRSDSSDSENQEETSVQAPVNKFQNDGSFMEMFKKRMEEEQKKKTEDDALKNKPKQLPVVGKRRGGSLILKTGAVKKKKSDDEEESSSSDAWTKYMNEVKKYKQQSCQDEDKTRPLVK